MIEVSPEEGFFVGKEFMNQNKTKIIILIGIMGAISFVLQLLEFPHIGFLAFEFSDLPSAVIAASFGPLPGVATELVKNLLKALTTKNEVCRRAC